MKKNKKGVKGINYGNGKSLSTAYDNRQRLTTFNVSGVLGYNYTYNNTYFNETTDRVSYAQNIYDSTLDRSYQYDQVGRLVVAHSGAEARAHAIHGQWGTQDGPFSQGYDYDAWGNITGRSGWGGWNASYSSATFNAKNQMTINPGHGTAMQYDDAGNMTHDGLQAFTYDAVGSQVQAPSYNVTQGHDGDGLRVKNTDWGATTYYLHSTVLGGQVVAELEGNGSWRRGYVYAGGQLVALQQFGEVNWAHQDPVNKSQRITNAAGAVVAGIELDPWGGATPRSWNNIRQPHEYTTYDRGQTGDESLFRRYHGWWSRFAHPDPYDGSYSLSDPQSFNRYAYVQNDPVNFVDPNGLNGEFTCAPGDPKCELGTVTVGDGGPDPLDDRFFTGNGAGPTFRPVGGGGGGGGGGGRAGGRMGENPQKPSQSVEACVANVLGRYLGREALTLLKQAALNAGIGLSVLAARFFIGHAIGGTIAAGTLTDIGIAIGIRMDHLSRGIVFLGGAIWAGAKLYPQYAKESFNNKREVVRALKECYDQG